MDENSGLTVEDFVNGNQVRFICGELHKDMPAYFPPVGTIGTVAVVGVNGLFVQWPSGTTSEDDEWFVPTCFVEKVG